MTTSLTIAHGDERDPDELRMEWSSDEKLTADHLIQALELLPHRNQLIDIELEFRTDEEDYEA